jgi:hypothetical protein
MEGQFGFEIRFSRLGVKRGRVTDLGILPGQAFSQATAIGSNGIVVGWSGTANYTLFGWSITPGAAAQGWMKSNPAIQTVVVEAGGNSSNSGFRPVG